MNQRRPTTRQFEVLEFIREFMEWHGYSPSLREISSHLGISGPQNARKHLDALEKKGYLKRTPRLARGIELTGEPAARGGSPPLKVPIVGSVRAGSLALAIENIEGYTFIDSAIFKCRTNDEHFMLKIEGSSMTEAGIDEDDYILVRSQKTARNRDIVVAMVDGDTTVKRFFRHQDYILLQPENSAMRPIIVKKGKFSILGKVVSVIKNI
jgi:repressor LexA